MTTASYIFWKTWRIIQTVTQGLYRRLVSIPLSIEESEFCEGNAAFWGELARERRIGRRDGYVLVPVGGHPVIKLSDASFASIVACARFLKLLFLTTETSGGAGTQLLASYPVATIVYLNGWRHPWQQAVACLRATKAYARLSSPADVLAFHEDGIKFGDIVYDEVLAGGYATLDRVDRRVWDVLRRFYFLRGFIIRLLRQYDIRTSVFAHTIGLQGGTLSRYLLSQGIEVLWRVGSHQVLIKRYRGLQDVGVYPVKPEPGYFRLMLEGDDGTIRRRAEEYLERRFSQQVEHPTVALAFNAAKTVYTSPEPFCAAFKLPPGRPIVFVMLHAFNDYPHSHFAKPMLFQDYYWWFRRTLEIAQEIPEVNWVFKEHPAAPYYITEDVDLHRVFAGVNDLHVRFLPATADFNARSIPHLAHAIVTCVGTAGLEYATFGIPCILGGESGYSGLGFTIELKTPKAYEACLRQIWMLPRLTAEQVVRAKLAAYFYFCVMESARYHFCPKFTDVQVSEWNASLTARLWKEAAAQFRSLEHVGRMKTQAEELGRFVSDPIWTQYVDFRQFPFLRQYVGGASGSRMSVPSQAGTLRSPED